MTERKIVAQIKKGADIIGKKVVSLLKEEKILYDYVRWKSGKTHYVLTVMLKNGEFRFARFAEIILISCNEAEVEMVADFLIMQLINKLKQIASKKPASIGRAGK